MGDFFSGANGLEANRKLPFFPANFSGDLQIDVCKGIDTRTGPAFLVEFTVLSSNLSGVEVGTGRTWHQKTGPTKEMQETGYRACVGFLLAAYGKDTARDATEIKTVFAPQQDALLNAAIGEKQPLRGQRVHLQTVEKSLKVQRPGAPPGVFTVHTFSPVVATVKVA
jgi:hypothetical protein